MDRWPDHLTLDETSAFLGTDDLDVLDLVAQGALRLLPAGVPREDVRKMLTMLVGAGRG